MTVNLFPPVTSHPGHVDGEPLTEGPRFVRTGAMTRWHRVRSGIRYTTGRTVYNLWCNGYVAGDFLARDEPLPGEPVCGMCDGKAVGSGQETDGPPGRDLLFQPRHIKPPRNCPASRRGLFEELPGGRVGKCLACGDLQPLRAMGGPYNGHYSIVQHPPGSALVPPCAFHRWSQLTAVDGHVRCACGRDLYR